MSCLILNHYWTTNSDPIVGITNPPKFLPLDRIGNCYIWLQIKEITIPSFTIGIELEVKVNILFHFNNHICTSNSVHYSLQAYES